MTKMIPLTRGKFALIDDEDFERINAHVWHFDHGYASRTPWKKKKIYMHREVLEVDPDLIVDHINNDNKLDNRKSNLRVSTTSQNMANSGTRSTNTSGYKGVTWNTQNRIWQAQICVRYKHISLGAFRDPIDAARAYDSAARKYFGEFAHTNFPDGAA